MGRINKLYHFTMILILLCNSGIVKGQNREDHLEPNRGIFHISDLGFEYDVKIRKVLFKGLSDSPEIRFQVVSSFGHIGVLDIEYDRDEGKNILIYHRCSKHEIQCEEEWEKIKIEKFKTEIDRKSVERIRSLFSIAIEQVRYPKKFVHVFDGATYYFSVDANDTYGQKSGMVSSPDRGTKMGRLVEIGGKLIELAKSNKEMIKFSDELQKEIDELMAEFSITDGGACK